VHRRVPGRRRSRPSSLAECLSTSSSSPGKAWRELIAANRIAVGSDADLAQVPLGVAVRAGATKPDVSTVEASSAPVTSARTVAVPGSTSGIWLQKELFPRLA
jgi:molybdate transport system substrate-binding protein